MKPLLLLTLSLVSAGVLAQEIPTNGEMPPNYPTLLMVQRVPEGSGIPSAGGTAGYSAALPAAAGLYQVPWFLTFQSTAATIWPREVDVKCYTHNDLCYCGGYHVDGILE